MSTNEPPPQDPTGSTPPPPPNPYGDTPPPAAPTPPPTYGSSEPPPSYGAGSPPPPPTYGAPPSNSPAWDLGAALSYGWEKFRENAGQIIIASLVLFVGLLIAIGISAGLQAALLSNATIEVNSTTGAIESTDGSGFFMVVLVAALSSAIFFVIAQVIGASVIRGALGITEGRPFRTADVFSAEKIGPVIITSLIIGALVLVGTILCYLPGLIVGFATSYSLYFVIDKDMEPIEAIKASVNLVKDNLGSTLVWYIIGGIVAGAGAIACGVGLLVTIPLVLIGTAYTYKVLTNQPVAA